MKAVKRALTRKVFGKVPVWVLVIVAGAGLYWWRARHPSSAAGGTASAPAPVSSDLSSPASLGGGSGGGGGGQPPPPDASGLGTPVSTDPTQLPPAWWDTPPAWLVGPAPTPGDINPAPASPDGTVVRPNGAKPSQPILSQSDPRTVPEVTKAGRTNVTPLQWGGQTFTTQSQFDAWARKHGSTTKKELSQHPEATRIYSQLGKNPYVAATVPNPHPPAAQRTPSAPQMSRTAATPTPAPARATATPTPTRTTTVAPKPAAPLPTTKVTGGKI